MSTPSEANTASNDSAYFVSRSSTEVRGAVGETGLGVQPEGVGQAVGRGVVGRGEQRDDPLITGPGEQRLVDVGQQQLLQRDLATLVMSRLVGSEHQPDVHRRVRVGRATAGVGPGSAAAGEQGRVRQGYADFTLSSAVNTKPSYPFTATSSHLSRYASTPPV